VRKNCSSALFVQPGASFATFSTSVVVGGVALVFSSLLRQHETGNEHSSPNNLAALPQKDGCKNRFYEQIWSASCFTSPKNLLAAYKRQTALSAKNAGKALFLSSTNHAQKVAIYYGNAGI
jgi:hypothetical protein